MKSTFIFTIIISLLDGAAGAIQFRRARPQRDTTVQAGQTIFKAQVGLSVQEISSGKEVSSVEFQLRNPSGAEVGWVPANISWNGSSRNFNANAAMTIPNTAGQWDWRIRASDSDDASMTSDWFPINVESTTTGPNDTGPNIQAAMTAILNVARANNGRLRPKFVRLGFHDCVGGCDGCVDLGNPDNFGLEEPIDALASVVTAHTSDGGLTRADVWAMAAMVSAEDAQPNNIAGFTYSFEWYGRSTCDATDGKGGPERALPSSDLPTSKLLQFFFGEFGLNERETVAIMGAHSIGSLSRENSGFDGPNGWTNNNNVLDNRYYSELIGGDRNLPTDDMTVLLNAPNWNQVLITNPDPIADRFQWNRGGGGGG